MEVVLLTDPSPPSPMNKSLLRRWHARTRRIYIYRYLSSISDVSKARILSRAAHGRPVVYDALLLEIENSKIGTCTLCYAHFK